LAGLGREFQAILGGFLPLLAKLVAAPQKSVARVGFEPTTKGL
jgi:hypothetical protein